MKKKDRKSATLPPVRVTQDLLDAVAGWWLVQRKSTPDMTMASAIRALVQRGLER